MPGTVSKKYVFNNNADGMYPLVLTIIEDLGQINEHTAFKVKMILVELITNSLKHSGQGDTTIAITASGNIITIKKTDTGNGLAVRCGNNLLEWPLPGKHHAGKIITVYNDSSAVLKAKLHNNCMLLFFIEETEETDPIDINSLAEHFGLMIITRACDKFEYGFDIDTCTNSFTVSLTV
ncbi:ATP-binding protein [Mucilaginibacter terrigena]|uniref:ATP-binding protein n=1 Tax=Mucilaginibacter terrigena TaxID=2492395 RepID=A0A4Q5LRY1_9SPHI|nr:ATP-binding protein [Mucilaginibacter terrigena]RYU92109.1 ATP-binding protein [Mucilaginibacter terrigena]